MARSGDAHFDELVQLVLKREGGYVNDPVDRGGETNFGISKRAFPKVDIKKLTPAKAAAIYKKEYWGPAQCAALPEAIRDIHFDSAINHGVHMAMRLLQRAAGVLDDGRYGPKTAAAAQTVTVQAYVRQRLLYIDRIIANDPKQVRFKRGWVRRITSFLK